MKNEDIEEFEARVDELYNHQINAYISALIDKKRVLEKVLNETTRARIDPTDLLDDISEYKKRLILAIYDKIDMVEKLTDNYVKQTGMRPDKRQLDRLATWILQGSDDCMGTHVLNERQLNYRKLREYPLVIRKGHVLGTEKVPDEGRHVRHTVAPFQDDE